MKMRGGMLLRKGAALLTMALLAGMLSGTAPINALAQEDHGAREGKLHEITYCVYVYGYQDDYEFTDLPTEIKALDVKTQSEMEVKSNVYDEYENSHGTNPEKIKVRGYSWTWNLPNGEYEFWLDGSLLEKMTFTEDGENSGSGYALGIYPYYYAVSFYDGESLKELKYIKNEDKIPVPKTPQKEGYTFAGWMTEAGGNTAFDFNTQIRQVTNIYASWEPESGEDEKEHQHSWGNTWKKDSTVHWHECSGCKEKKDVSAHRFDEWITDREASENEAGTRHRTCSVCGFIENGTIPPSGEDADPGQEENQGKITQEVEKGENVPDISIAMTAQELADIVLTDAEKQQMRNGTDIGIILDVKEAKDTISSEDKASVEEALNDFSAGLYLDINLYKIIGTERSKISETAEEIAITIAVPDGLKNTNSENTREFAVIRVHNGQADLLEDADDSDDTISIRTDRFSAYALVYRDIVTDEKDEDYEEQYNQNDGDDNDGGSVDGSNDSAGNQNSGTGGDSHSTGTQRQKNNGPKTGDNTHLELYATLAMIAGFSYLLLYFKEGRRGMTEETKQELVSRLIGWAKRGGKIRKFFALVTVFGLLAYYHAIGKKAAVKWKEVYGE